MVTFNGPIGNPSSQNILQQDQEHGNNFFRTWAKSQDYPSCSALYFALLLSPSKGIFAILPQSPNPSLPLFPAPTMRCNHGYLTCVCILLMWPLEIATSVHFCNFFPDHQYPVTSSNGVRYLEIIHKNCLSWHALCNGVGLFFIRGRLQNFTFLGTWVSVTPRSQLLQLVTPHLELQIRHVACQTS